MFPRRQVQGLLRFANTGIAHESLFLTEWSQFIYYSFRAAVQDLSSKE